MRYLKNSSLIYRYSLTSGFQNEFNFIDIIQESTSNDANIILSYPQLNTVQFMEICETTIFDYHPLLREIKEEAFLEKFAFVE